MRSAYKVIIVLTLCMLVAAAGCREDAGTIQIPTGKNYPQSSLVDSVYTYTVDADFFDAQEDKDLPFIHPLSSSTVSVTNYKSGKVTIILYSLGGAKLYEQIITEDFYEQKPRSVIAVPAYLTIYCEGFTGSLSIRIATE